jgi:hypothetical protein
MHFVAGEYETAIEEVRDAETGGLLDIAWLERCPILEPARVSGELRPICRRVELRAARIRAILDAH